MDHIKGRLLCYHNPDSQKQLKMLIDQIHPDVIHTQNLLSISYWVWNYASQKGIRVVHTLRDYWLLDPKTVLNQSNKYMDAIHQSIFRRVSNQNSIIVTSPSEATLRIFDQYGYFKKSQRHGIVNCVDVDDNELNENISAAQQKSGNRINFIFVGTLGMHKGIDVLLNTFSRVNNPDISLTICGSGKLEEYVKECCKKDQRIHYFGQLKKDALAEQYKNADAIIVPSVWEEPFGRIVIEGAKYGLPCIGSNRGGVPEIIKTLQDGIIFDPGKPAELEEAIRTFSNRDKLKSYLPSIKENLHKYSSAEQTEAFLKIYNK